MIQRHTDKWKDYDVPPPPIYPEPDRTLPYWESVRRLPICEEDKLLAERPFDVGRITVWRHRGHILRTYFEWDTHKKIIRLDSKTLSTAKRFGTLWANYNRMNLWLGVG